MTNYERIKAMSRYKDIDLYTKILREEIRDIKNFENSMYRKGKRNGLILAKAIVLNDERIPIADVSAEAVKEFAEKLKEKLGDCHIVSDGEYFGFDCGDIHECIDTLLKEMVGEEE